MEQRDKKARLDSLSELRRLRHDGGNRLESLDKMEPTGSLSNTSRCNSDFSDEEDSSFIDQDTRSTKRPAIFSFKSRTTGGTTEKRIDESVIKNDEYFQSLLCKMDEEISGEEESEMERVEEGAGLPDGGAITMDGISMSSMQPPTDGILSSEYAPAEGQFEIDNGLINEQLPVEWSDFDDEAINDSMEIDQPSLEVIQPSLPPMEVVETTNQQLTCPSVTITDGEEVKFYFLDAYEKPNGTIYLFGKIPQGNGFVSCCVTVNNMRRNLFFLPREFIEGTEEEVSLKDIHEEISELAIKYHLGKFGCKKVSRRYAFEIPDIPIEADYIKMVYPFSDPILPKGVAGRTFSHVFGTGTSALELFLVKRKIMGPGWLKLIPKSTSKRNVRSCKVILLIYTYRYPGVKWRWKWMILRVLVPSLIVLNLQ